MDVLLYSNEYYNLKDYIGNDVQYSSNTCPNSELEEDYESQYKEFPVHIFFEKGGRLPRDLVK